MTIDEKARAVAVEVAKEMVADRANHWEIADAVIEAYESAKQKETDGWRDIASAPKDGTHFLGFWPGGGEWRAPIIGIRMTWFWCAGSAASAIGRDGEFTAHFHRDDPIAGVSPSHWRPLPEPPSALLSAGGEG